MWWDTPALLYTSTLRTVLYKALYTSPMQPLGMSYSNETGWYYTCLQITYVCYKTYWMLGPTNGYNILQGKQACSGLKTQMDQHSKTHTPPCHVMWHQMSGHVTYLIGQLWRCACWDLQANLLCQQLRLRIREMTCQRDWSEMHWLVLRR